MFLSTLRVLATHLVVHGHTTAHTRPLQERVSGPPNVRIHAKSKKLLSSRRHPVPFTLEIQNKVEPVSFKVSKLLKILNAINLYLFILTLVVFSSQ